MADLSANVSDSIAISESVGVNTQVYITAVSAKTAINHSTTTEYVTFIPGTANGIKVLHNFGLSIHFKNPSLGSDAVFSLVARQDDKYDDFSITVPNYSETVPNDEHMELLLNDDRIFRLDDGYLQIVCDKAGQVLVLTT